MDIRCPSCSTLYEFDEDRIGAKGVNVRCSACGQVFKVRKADPDAPKELWMVKRESTGEVINFDDLSTLQRWIIEQKVSRRDLISKTGDTWKSLGSIHELQAFFSVVDELNEPRQGSRDTDGYLTANQRRAPERDEQRADETDSAESPARRRLMAGLDTSASREPAPARTGGGATLAHGESPHGLPDARPANESAPQHAEDALRLAAGAATVPLKPARRGTPPSSKAYSLGTDEPGPATAYSLGERDIWTDNSPAISFAAPALATGGGTSDYTAEYSALRKRGSRWPTVLLALLLLAAGVLIVLAAFRPELLGFGDPPVEAGADAGEEVGEALAAATDAGGAGETQSAGSGQNSADGSGSAGSDGSGDQAGAGSGDGADGDGDDDTEPEAAAPDTARARDAASGRDSGANAATARDAGTPRDAAVAPRDTARETAPRDSGSSGRSSRGTPPPREPDPPAATGYDGMMESGNAELRGGNYQVALNHFSNAADARPNSAEAHVGVARAYESMGRHDLAAVRYQRATSVNSRYTPAWLGLGDAKRRSGDASGACEAYARVLSIVRTGRSADRARSAMQDLSCD